MKLLYEKIHAAIHIQIFENSNGERKIFINAQEQQCDKELTDDVIMDIANAEMTVKYE